MKRILISAALALVASSALVAPASAQRGVQFGYQDRIFRQKYVLPETMDVGQAIVFGVAVTMALPALPVAEVHKLLGGRCAQDFVDGFKQNWPETPDQKALEGFPDIPRPPQPTPDREQVTCAQQVAQLYLAYADPDAADRQVQWLARLIRTRFADAWLSDAERADPAIREGAKRLALLRLRADRLIRKGAVLGGDVLDPLNEGALKSRIRAFSADEPFVALDQKLAGIESQRAGELARLHAEKKREEDERVRMEAARREAQARAAQRESRKNALKAEIRQAQRALESARAQAESLQAALRSHRNGVSPSPAIRERLANEQRNIGTARADLSRSEAMLKALENEEKPAVSASSAALDPAELAAFRDKVRSCWRMPATDDEKIYVHILLRLNRDGTLAQSPVITDGRMNPKQQAAFDAFASSALKALIACQPYTMFKPDSYDAWKELEPRFYPHQPESSPNQPRTSGASASPAPMACSEGQRCRIAEKTLLCRTAGDMQAVLAQPAGPSRKRVLDRLKQTRACLVLDAGQDVILKGATGEVTPIGEPPVSIASAATDQGEAGFVLVSALSGAEMAAR